MIIVKGKSSVDASDANQFHDIRHALGFDNHFRFLAAASYIMRYRLIKFRGAYERMSAIMPGTWKLLLTFCIYFELICRVSAKQIKGFDETRRLWRRMCVSV